jgi:4-hydroxyphenylacetate 3-monooxygenase
MSSFPGSGSTSTAIENLVGNNGFGRRHTFTVIVRRRFATQRNDAQETRATIEDGVVWPSRVALYAIMALQSDLNPKLMDLARELSSGALIMTPSSHLDYEDPEIARALGRYLASPNYPSRKRVALTKLAWDLIGSEFAGRHQQYEKFYAGPAFANKLHVYGNYNFADAKLFAEAALMK